jgi:tetratricopeptide (TPR) repeat protein
MLLEAWMPLQPAPAAMSPSKDSVRVGARESAKAVFLKKFRLMILSTTWIAIGCGIVFLPAIGESADANSFSRRAESAFKEAQTRARHEPANPAALIRLARAAFDWAEFARSDDRREEIAQAGIDAARGAISREPTNAAAHYWLGMDLGQLARTKTLGALRIVREMEDEFQAAASFNEREDFAGPHRSLGLLYRDAPGWPTSIGNRKKAREHLERAVHLHPEFPDNQLALLESFEDWADRQSFARQLKITEQTLADAKKKFTGPEWEASWADWNKRFAELKSKVGEVGKHTPPKGAR